MNSKMLYKFILISFFLFLNACSDPENETNLVNLYTVASLDIISIDFPADTTETVISINSQFDFDLQGLQSNGVDLINITSNVEWSLSDGALSTIDQQGNFTASPSAETITLTAQFGYLIQSIEIRVSSAKFDQVIQLDAQTLSVDMCQSLNIKPIARYVDESGNDEIRSVDSIVINTIEWIIRDQVDNNLTKRAYIETSNNQASLRTLAAGNLIIQAKANSVFQNTLVTSADFNQTVGNTLNEIKLCRSSDTDLSSCSVTSAGIEPGEVLSLISVASYQATDGSSFNENISKNSKWGIDNVTNASIALSVDQQSLDITGNVENSSATISVACGDIAQNIDTIDVSQGVILNSSVSCDVDCLSSTALISIDSLTVTSLDVTANDIALADNVSTSLDTQPAEIALTVTANYLNVASEDITNDSSLVYTIITLDGQSATIEEKAGSVGVFTVLGSGTAKIQLNYRSEIFVVLIEVP